MVVLLQLEMFCSLVFLHSAVAMATSCARSAQGMPAFYGAGRGAATLSSDGHCFIRHQCSGLYMARLEHGNKDQIVGSAFEGNSDSSVCSQLDCSSSSIELAAQNDTILSKGQLNRGVASKAAA